MLDSLFNNVVVFLRAPFSIGHLWVDAFILEKEQKESVEKRSEETFFK